jgi:dolichyl-phosphate-mannose--protein O-mannosyl transferase
MAEYADGVPRLDLCKPGENGSHATHWPLGGKSINYRWNRQLIDGESRVSYTYLVSNPVVWLGVLAGMLLSVVLVVGRAVYGTTIRDARSFGWIAVFGSLYAAYAIAILQIDRVMYLYHYFLPLIFGLLNLAVLWNYLFGEALAAGRWHARINLGLLLALAAAVYLYFAALTYGRPLTTMEMEHRAWLDIWRLEPVR